MKIARLQAERVHGYLPIDVEFFDDLTFLTGLNGSGKTSALRLLMALLTPSLDELGSIEFGSAIVTAVDGDEEIVVRADKTTDGVTLAVSPISEPLTMSSSEMELYVDMRRREEARSPILEKYQQHPVFARIRSVSTPMFLGLDRRFFPPGAVSDDANDARRRDYLARRYWHEDPQTRSNGISALVEINYLVVTRLQEIRAAQELLDERLRAQFFTKAFEYKPSDLFGAAPTGLPSRKQIDTYRGQLLKIGRAAEGLRIPVPEIQSAMTGFFERMTKVVDALDKSRESPPSNKRTKKKGAESSAFDFRSEYLEWIVNKPQADRILEHLQLLHQYIESRDALRDPISRFLELVNGFFEQTSKVVELASAGQLTVKRRLHNETRPISALSSGERQLLVMLGHLSLNPHLAGSGVFIVDEPELSLHIDWQEKFVDAIREANPKVQLILATHSPAIILDRVDNCRTLAEVPRD